MVVLTQVDTDNFATLLVGLSIVFLGVSPVGPLVSQLVMTASPPERAGAAASLASTGGELGVALGIATLGSIATALYQSTVAIPSSVPADAAGAAGESMPGAFIAASDLPANVANGVLDTAREAFSSALNVTSVICAIAFAALAVLAWATIRAIPPMGAHGGPPPEEAPAGEDEEVPAPAV
jgi:DHA2 family multidrug resistance protein-like MFS transporter